MNYIRGVANAISAPYQYYKELPPINPSTLTGAIDVIVIQRPGADGETELACSPFHVRFGKWQVLRPGEKKVNVSVNGNPIPFNMKIGEAGEAFFVFETDEDVPADLITSPILQPTEPETVPDVVDERFGVKQDEEDAMEDDADRQEEKLRHDEVASQEPDYLDLNAQGNDLSHTGRKPQDDDRASFHNTTPKQIHHTPSFLKRSDSRSTINQKSSLSLRPPLPHMDSVMASGERTPEMEYQDRQVDEALKVLNGEGHAPEVEYHHDVALDMEGYHAGYHGRQASDQTVRSSELDHFALPQSTLDAGPSQSEDSPKHGPLPFPVFRATSEPPPDVMDHIEPNASQILPGASSEESQKIASPRLQIQEYSWEWGAFPQPSPMKTTFSKSGRLEGPVYTNAKSHRRAKTMQIKNGRLGGMQLPVLQDSDDEMLNDAEPMTHRGRSLAEKEHGRSHSVPAALQGSPNRHKHKQRRRRQWKEYEDHDEEEVLEDVGGEDDEHRTTGQHSILQNGDALQGDDFGIGGTLHANKRDPTKFILSIEGRRVGFQVSVLPMETTTNETNDQAKEAAYKFFKNKDSVEVDEVFQKGIINYDDFLDDPTVVLHPRLVIRWIGVEQYVTRQDGSPLMDALIHWRQAALHRRASGDNLRPVSPTSEDESGPASPTQNEATLDAKAGLLRAQSEPPEEHIGELPSGLKPTSSSWSQWWSRSRRTTEIPTRPTGPGSAPTPSSVHPESIPIIIEPPAEAAPPSTAQPVNPPSDKEKPAENKKYAKTLRLTSDQLKSLNLRPGPNSITFSLSTTGAIAATARIFVWDHTDAVVVSDIDGTITKSDALGHVFAMVGRDWTHLGVAKLYTDITRNGYKIMYLTSRAIGQADATRGYLKGIKQNDYQLPEGPVIMSPDRLMASLHREVVLRKPEVFKMACLRDIQRLFGEHAKYPFYAGFGNRITDALSYRSVNIPSARIFTIDSAGEVKMELLELAGYKSSYIHMTDLVDQMFPPIHRKWTPEFTDFNYWRAPVQEFPLPDFSPPSPALSARSDTSNQSTLARLRNFSLVGSRQSTMKSEIGAGEEGEERSNQLRQMSSFERLSSTLGFMSSVNELRRSLSPDPYDSEDEDDDISSAAGRRRERRRSITSMPGSLHEDDMGLNDDEEEEGEYDEENQEEDFHPEQHAEEAFDDDLLAAGEMSKVPFL